MSDSGAQPHAAYIEDYNEDANTTLPETRQTANVAAKRSKPDLARVKITELGRDEASDSGYSSHTAATLNSGNSSLGSKAGSATLTLDTSVESLAANKRKPLLVGRQSYQTPQSPNKPMLRRSDSKRPSKERVRQESCRCEECLGKAKSKGSRPAVSGQKPSPTEAGQIKQRSGPKVDTIPSSPAPKAAADAPILHPAQPRPRRQSYRATPRPVSFHGGIQPQPMYYQTVLITRPPSTAPTPSPFPQPSYPPPTYFLPHYQSTGPPGQPSPLHTQPPQPLSYNPPPRPQSRQWAPGPHLPPQQPIVYSAPPVVDYPHSAQYGGALPPSHPVLHRTFSERDRERPAPLRDDYFPYDPYDEDYYRMRPPPPPPPVPVPPKTSADASARQRPAMRHVASTSARVARPERFFPECDEEEQIERSPTKYKYEGHEQPRRPSLASRPSAATSIDRSHGINGLERDFAQLAVESSSAAAKQRRRMTFYGGTLPRDLERRAEAYQAQKSTPVDPTSIPLTADSLKLVRRKTQTSNSDTGSRASGEGRASREGSDVKPRSATGRRGSSDTKSHDELDGFTMRFNASQGVNVDLKGNSEGRTISLRQSRDGQGNMELSIGSKYDSKERSRRRQSYVDGAGVRELEYARTTSRMGRSSREVVRDRTKDRSMGPSHSRKSSRNRKALME
ncbi:MAG: hypothetical protein LQ350_002147 [Teloschistes chrysophthalmus]|nr:MAG: hypothetical protein LQ350_002147 [Niorma chrysophthalma]